MYRCEGTAVVMRYSCAETTKYRRSDLQLVRFANINNLKIYQVKPCYYS